MRRLTPLPVGRMDYGLFIGEIPPSADESLCIVSRQRRRVVVADPAPFPPDAGARARLSGKS